MEVNNKVQPPSMEPELWLSPDLFSNHPGEQRELTSTPYQSGWSMLGSNNGDGESLSKVDSGYSSLNSLSADSTGRLFDKECHICKRAKQSAHSPTDCTCACPFVDHSPCVISLESVPKPTLPSSHPCSMATDLRPIKELFDEPMDSSLYESEPFQGSSEERQDSNYESMEIGEEQSVDFADSGIGLCLKDHSEVSNQSEIGKEQVCKSECYSDSEEFFTPPATKSDNNNKVRPTLNLFKETEDDNRPSKTELFRNAVKKVCTLNIFKHFNRNGIETVDILYQLGVQKNCPVVVKKILNYLSDRDLDTMSSVCKAWFRILKNDDISFKRWKAYKIAMQMKRENYFSPSKSKRSGGRQSLFNITNHNSPIQEGATSSPCTSPNVSPRSMRFRSYQKAAKNLKEGERLLRCPKCRYPSHDKGSPNVNCTRASCQHRFCVWCFQETTKNVPHICPPFYTPLRRSTPKVPRLGSKTCKRNLRRL